MSIIWQCYRDLRLDRFDNRQYNVIQSVNMEKKQATVSKQTLYISVLVVFIIGFVSGVVFTVMKTGGGVPSAASPQQTAQSPQEAQAILNLEAEVTANPDNYDAWTRLGHLYFDSDQVDKAIGAYTKSLELNSADPNVWTDLGVMYRRSGNPEKAIESFDKAIELDATHLQSRFNRGIVLNFDLGKTAEAIASWQSVLAIAPQYKTANGMSLQDLIDQVKNQPASGGNK
jgi:cytochrome c-type biogenesis protein CcmH/NrfG